MRRGFLDACVLVPPLVRGLLLNLAEGGGLAPLWSPRVLEEWARAARRIGGPAEEAVARDTAAAMRARWPDACVTPDDAATEALSLPDPNDAHVLAAALAGRAELLITFNLRDFPARKLRDLGLAPLHPDAFLWEEAGRSPAVRAAAETTLERFAGLRAEHGGPRLIKRVGLPRLAKLLKSEGLA